MASGSPERFSSASTDQSLLIQVKPQLDVPDYFSSCDQSAIFGGQV
jgi:hypothetical protein